MVIDLSVSQADSFVNTFVDERIDASYGRLSLINGIVDCRLSNCHAIWMAGHRKIGNDGLT
jgi:hypothetical protein